ncbi:unnamed protein product, partial [marine sediment metagenome]
APKISKVRLSAATDWIWCTHIYCYVSNDLALGMSYIGFFHNAAGDEVAGGLVTPATWTNGLAPSTIIGLRRG